MQEIETVPIQLLSQKKFIIGFFFLYIINIAIPLERGTDKPSEWMDCPQPNACATWAASFADNTE
jgi:hypothetical protein